MFISNIDIFNNAEQCVLVVLLYYSFINECQCKVSLVCFFFFFWVILLHETPTPYNSLEGHSLQDMQIYIRLHNI